MLIRCPKCGHCLLQSNPQQWTFTCPKCRQRFRSMLVKMRAKRSRGNRDNNSRWFSLRVYTATGERLIEFMNYEWGDFELRSGDAVIISYIDGRVAMIQNFTIGRYYYVYRAWTWLHIAIAIVVAVILSGIVLAIAHRVLPQ